MQNSGRLVKNSFKACAVALPLVLASSLVVAQDSGFYVGASAGRSFGNISSTDLTAGLQARGFSVGQTSTSDRDTAVKLTGGYDFNRFFAAEVNYFDLGSYTFVSNLAPRSNLGGEGELTGLGLDLVAKVPLSENLSGLLRAGLTRARIKESFANFAGTGFAYDKDAANETKVGLGLEYKFNDNFSLRAEWEKYRLPASQFIDSSANAATIGVVYRFGRAAAPAPVVAAPAPAPTPPPAPAPAPQPVVVNLAASALFDFDQSELKPAGRQELDNLIRQINGLSYDSVIVIGHTDRIGTREYNLGLSERRANTVRDYLVQGGIQSGRITARGVANDDPVTSPSDCRGLGSNAATIACLEPDRRVVVEIHATRNP